MSSLKKTLLIAGLLVVGVFAMNTNEAQANDCGFYGGYAPVHNYYPAYGHHFYQPVHYPHFWGHGWGHGYDYGYGGHGYGYGGHGYGYGGHGYGYGGHGYGYGH